MLESQRIELRLVELRSAIAAHPADGEVAALEALTTEYRAADVRRAAAIITEAADLDAARAAGDLSVEQRELDGIGRNLQFGNYVSLQLSTGPQPAVKLNGITRTVWVPSNSRWRYWLRIRVQMRATTDTDGQVQSGPVD